jgi:phage gpG-like protein
MAEPAIKGSFDFEILIENDARFLAAIARAKGAADDLTQPLTQIGKMLSKSAKAIFELQGPGQYPDLAESTKKAKLKRWGQIYPILRASGRLEKSLTEPGSRDSVLDVANKDTLYWGTRVPYGIYHQSLEPRRGKLPWRPFLIWGPDSRFSPGVESYRIGRALSILNNYVLRQLGANIGPTGGEE